MPERLTPEQRRLRSLTAVHTSWANTPDPAARTAPARRAASERFDRQVDPDGTLDPKERSRRAEHARKAYFYGLALKSARARSARVRATGLLARAADSSRPGDGREVP